MIDLSYRAINKAYYAKKITGYSVTPDMRRRSDLLNRAYSVFGQLVRDGKDCPITWGGKAS